VLTHGDGHHLATKLATHLSTHLATHGVKYEDMRELWVLRQVAGRERHLSLADWGWDGRVGSCYHEFWGEGSWGRRGVGQVGEGDSAARTGMG